jgi:hypothetical protein
VKKLLYCDNKLLYYRINICINFQLAQVETILKTESHCRNKTTPAGKMRAGLFCLVAVLVITQAGCAQQRIYENLYEGIRINNELQASPPERGLQTSPDYRQYRNTLRTGKPDAP